MKYLLVGINAKYIHSNLALHCLKAYAEINAPVTPVVKEYTINMPEADIIQGIYKEAPDFIGFSVYIWNVDVVMRIIKDLHILLPDTLIYLGGPESSFNSEDILKAHPEISGIMIGEGEGILTDLISCFESQNSKTGSKGQEFKTDFDTPKSIAEGLNKIPGLCYRKDNNEIITTPTRECMDLSLVPFPYKNLSDFENRIIYYETSRGCPFGCSYCLSSVDKTVRFRNMDMVKEELLFFLNHKVSQVKLVDRTFNIDHKRSLEMLNFIKENDNQITNFHFEIAGDILTNEEIDVINTLRPGLIQLEIGVQSTNSETLKAINRRTDLTRLSENVARLLSPCNVHLHLDLIAGLPYENLDSFKNSFNEVYNMKSHELQLGFLKVLNGAPINNLINDQDIKYSTNAPYEVFSTKYLSYEDICQLKHVEEMLEIYHNSCQFTLSEEYVLGIEKSPFDMYQNLYDFYTENDYPVMQCKRANRYDILLKYVCQKHSLTTSEEQKFKYLLTLDYYSREKAKARPTFAPDISAYKRQLHQLNNDLLSEKPGRIFHLEPSIEGNKMLVFDYDNRSKITGNAAIEYINL